MGYFFKNKTNVILTCVLCAVLACASVLTYMFVFKKEKTLVPDFSNKTISDVQTWCKSFETNPCTINSEYSDEFNKDYVIYQSIAADDELTDTISFTISLGNDETIELIEIGSETKKADIENWVNENKLTDVTYVEQESSTIEEGFVIKIEPNNDIKVDTKITVYISSGKEINSSGNINITADKYTDISESEFISKMKALGLNAQHSDNKDAYSSKISKGNVVWHGSGEYIQDETIRYGLSLGATSSEIKVDKGTYVGMTLEAFKEEITKLGTSGLVATHNEDWDEKSSSVAKGSIVFHGYGTYTDGENIRYGLSLGSDEIVIEEGQFVGKTLSEFESAIKELGLVAYHKTSLDVSTSDTSKVSKISANGYGTYKEGENCYYGLYVANSSGYISIKKNQYVDYTYSDFETAIKALGLVPTHKSSWDEDTSDTSKVGKICFNGYSDYYSKGENCSYGLYTAKETVTTVEIAEGKYVGYSESDYKSAMTSLGLVATHYAAWDGYSDSVDKGKILVNGYGTYKSGEVARYGLSLGKKETVVSVNVNANAYVGKSETEIKSAISALGLNPIHDSSKDAYSTITKDYVVCHDSGTFNSGTNVYYGLSLGVKTLYLNTKHFYNNQNSDSNSYEEMHTYLSSVLSGFTNITYEKVESADTKIGLIEYIKVNGSSSYDPGSYACDTPIVIGIVNTKKPS